MVLLAKLLYCDECVATASQMAETIISASVYHVFIVIWLLFIVFLGYATPEIGTPTYKDFNVSD